MEKFDKSAIASILKVYSIKYNIEYLLGQTIFEPFPEELLSLNDSGKPLRCLRLEIQDLYRKINEISSE